MPTPPPDLSVLPATEADVPLLLGFIRELAEYERLAHTVEATETELRDTLFGPRPYAAALIARRGAEPAGHAVYFHTYSPFLARPGIYVEDVYVRPHLRGRGVGKALLAAVARVARDRNCARLEWSVLNWNTPSIEFYESLGARPQSEWTMSRMTDPAIAALAAGK